SLLHVAVADLEVLEDLLELREPGPRAGRRTQVRLGDDLDQRHTGPVQVDRGPAGQPIVQRLARILLEVDATDPHALHGAVPLLDLQPAVRLQRLVELRDLVPLGQVRIEVVLAREAADLVHRAVQAARGARAQLHRSPVHDRQRTGQPEAHRADVRVRRRTELGRVRAEQLGRGRELDVDLEADDGFPPHGAHPTMARSSAAAARTITPSCQRSAMSWPPTGRPSTVPIGNDSAGTPARFAVTVKMSARYIW